MIGLRFKPSLRLIATVSDQVELRVAVKKAVIEGSEAGKLSPTSINDHTRCINAFLNCMKDEGHVTERIGIPKIKMHETVPTLLTTQQVTAFALRFLRGHNICEVKSLYLKSQTSTNRFGLGKQEVAELDFQNDDEAEEQKVAFLRTALRDLPACRFR